MEVTFKSKEVAEAIASKVEAVTGRDCEAYDSQMGSVVIYDRTTVIARLTPQLAVIDVEPVGGLFDGEIVEIPTEARTVNDLREIAAALDEANMRAISSAVKH